MKNLSKIPAVLFAGGKSSRMGCDKALLPYGGFKTLSEFGYRNLKKLFENVYISTKSEKFNFDAPLIFDKLEESSPLVGIVSIFDTLECDEFFVLSVDMPMVRTEDILRFLDFANKNMDYDAIIAKSPSGIEPLFGIYRNSIYKNADIFIKENNHKLTALIKQSRCNLFEFENEDIFLNLNYPADYENALSLMKP